MPAAARPATSSRHAGRVRGQRLRRRPLRAAASQQMAPVKPIEWQDDSDAVHPRRRPELDQLHRRRPTPDLAAGHGPSSSAGPAPRTAGPAGINGYYLQIGDTGAWSIVKSDTDGKRDDRWPVGPRTALGTGTWHHLALTFDGTTITAADRRHHRRHGHRQHLHRGQAGLGGHRLPDRPVRQPRRSPPRGAQGAARPGRSTSGADTAKCVDDNDRLLRQRHQGADLGLQRHRRPAVDRRSPTAPSRSTASAWTSPAPATANGTLVELWDCNGGGNQQWQAAQRHAGQPRLRQVPRRPRLQHRQRHPAGHLDLQRRRQPAVASRPSRERPGGCTRPGTEHGPALNGFPVLNGTRRRAGPGPGRGRVPHPDGGRATRSHALCSLPYASVRMVETALHWDWRHRQ